MGESIIEVSQGKGTMMRTTEEEGVHIPHHIISSVGSEDMFVTGKLDLEAASPTPLAISTPIKQVFVKSGSSNAGVVLVFPTGNLYSTGYELSPGESIPLIIDDLAKISVYTEDIGEEVFYIGS